MMKTINYSIKWCIFVFVMTLFVQIQNTTAQKSVNDLIISNPSADYYNTIPARAVEKTITTITVAGTSPTFNLSDSCTLRATDYILLDEGTTINSTGPGQFSAIVMPCPN